MRLLQGLADFQGGSARGGARTRRGSGDSPSLSEPPSSVSARSNPRRLLLPPEPSTCRQIQRQAPQHMHARGWEQTLLRCPSGQHALLGRHDRGPPFSSQPRPRTCASGYHVSAPCEHCYQHRGMPGRGLRGAACQGRFKACDKNGGPRTSACSGCALTAPRLPKRSARDMVA